MQPGEHQRILLETFLKSYRSNTFEWYCSIQSPGELVAVKQLYLFTQIMIYSLYT